MLAIGDPPLDLSDEGQPVDLVETGCDVCVEHRHLPAIGRPADDLDKDAGDNEILEKIRQDTTLGAVLNPSSTRTVVAASTG